MIASYIIQIHMTEYSKGKFSQMDQYITFSEKAKCSLNEYFDINQNGIYWQVY